MHFNIGVIAVRLARQQGFNLHAFCLGGQRRKRRFAFGHHIIIALGLAKFDEFDMFVHLVFKPLTGLDGVFQPRAFLHFGLRCLWVIPQLRVFSELIQRVQLFKRVVPVKDASAAKPMTVKCY